MIAFLSPQASQKRQQVARIIRGLSADRDDTVQSYLL